MAAAPAHQSSDFLIVGAGLAGLTAARRLRAAGASVRVLEARARIGGRIFSVPELGEPYDAGGQFLHPNYTRLLKLVTDYGLQALSSTMQGATVSCYAQQRSVVNTPMEYVFKDPQAGPQLMNARFRLHQMARSLPDPPWSAPQAAEWDAMTFVEWVHEHINDAEARHVFMIGASFDMMLGWDNTSLLAVLTYIRAVGDAKETGKILLVDTGMGGLIRRMGTDLGEVITCNAVVSAIHQDAAGVTVISSAGAFHSRCVIVALAPSLADRIDMQPPVPAKRKMLQRLWADGPTIKTLLVYDRPWWRELGLAGFAISDQPGVALAMDASPPDRPQGVLAVFSSAIADLPDAIQNDAGARRQLVLDAVANFFGERARTPQHIVEANWYLEHWSAGCGSAPPPGMLTRFGATLRTAHDRVIWSGAETASEFIGLMEGAVRSGERAADEALILTGIGSTLEIAMQGNPSETLMLTGASGNLGQLVLTALLKTPAKRIVAGTRNPDTFVNPAPERVIVRKVDFEDATLLASAFKDVDRLLLISTDAIDPSQGRGAQQVAAVEAAVKAGVKHIVYTSMTRPEPGSMVAFARDHHLTERALANSSITWTVLRNNSYMHMLLQSLPPAIASGWFMSAANNGAVGYVTREDCAAAAAAALTSGATQCAMYDITGPQAVSTSELAALVSKASGKQVEVAHMSATEYSAALIGFGLPASFADMIVSFDLSAAKGHCAIVTTAVEELTGNKPKSVADFLAEHKAMLTPS